MGLPSRLMNTVLSVFTGIFGPSAVEVVNYATGGSGTSASPWTGWDTGVTWTKDKTYKFARGYYSFSTSLVITDFNRSEWDGGGAVFKYTGTGTAITFLGDKAIAANAGMMTGSKIHDIILDCTGTGSIGLLFQYFFNGSVENIEVRNLKTSGTTAGVKLLGCCGNYWKCVFPFDLLYYVGTQPTYGIWLAIDADIQNVLNTFMFCFPEGTLSHGFYLTNAITCAFIGCGAENCGTAGTGYGIYIDTTCRSCTFESTDVESCPHGEWYVGGENCVFNACSSFSNIADAILFHGPNNVWNGGETINVTLDVTSYQNKIIGLKYTGTASDVGTSNLTWWMGGYAPFFTNDLPPNIHPSIKVNVGSGDYTLYEGELFYYTGSGGHTVTLNAPGFTTRGKIDYVKNGGSGNIVVTNVAKLDGTIANLTLRPGQYCSFLYDTSSHWTEVSGPKLPLTVYSAGTVYTVTATSAAVAFGTTSPVKVLDGVGSYVLSARVNIKYNAATFAAARTLTIKLRRTNNTAGDVTASSTVITVPTIAVAVTGTFLVVNLPDVLYSTTNADDSITIFAGLDVITTAGTLDITEASIVARPM